MYTQCSLSDTSRKHFDTRIVATIPLYFNLHVNYISYWIPRYTLKTQVQSYAPNFSSWDNLYWLQIRLLAETWNIPTYVTMYFLTISFSCKSQNVKLILHLTIIVGRSGNRNEIWYTGKLPTYDFHMWIIHVCESYNMLHVILIKLCFTLYEYQWKNFPMVFILSIDINMFGFYRAMKERKKNGLQTALMHVALYPKVCHPYFLSQHDKIQIYLYQCHTGRTKWRGLTSGNIKKAISQTMIEFLHILNFHCC